MLTIAEAVTLKLGGATGLLEIIDTLIALLNVCAVLTFTFLAVFVIFHTATVAAIPRATSIVAEKQQRDMVRQTLNTCRCRLPSESWLTCMLQVGC